MERGTRKELRENVKDLNIKIVSGMEGLIELSVMEESEILVTAIVGMIGIRPTIEAIKAGKDIALANKETLVTAGHIIMPLAKEYQVAILPVDSEHSAIFQSLQGGQEKALHKILLTASGGPFRQKTREELLNIQVEDALKHPNWEMGRKITIDSSTLYYPERRFLPGDRLDFAALSKLTFEKPDMETFYGLRLAFEAGKEGGSLPTVFNAANELAVSKFLERKIKYLEIPEIIEHCMQAHKTIADPSVDEILQTEQEVYEQIESRW